MPTQVETTLTPTLTAGLAELCRQRPKDPVTWLATYLIEHKPPGELNTPGTGDALKSLMDAFSTPEGKEELRALFASLDKTGNGTISGKEWGQGVSKNKAVMGKFFGGMTVAEIGGAFKRLDTDGSGDLSWDEFEAGVESFDASARMAQALASVEGQKEFKDLWDAIDADGNGVLTADEWAGAVKDNAETMAKYFGGKASNTKAIKKAFKKLDKEGTGITWDTFLESSKVVF